MTPLQRKLLDEVIAYLRKPIPETEDDGQKASPSYRLGWAQSTLSNAAMTLEAIIDIERCACGNTVARCDRNHMDAS